MFWTVHRHVDDGQQGKEKGKSNGVVHKSAHFGLVLSVVWLLKVVF